ncbi:MAG: Uncharacterized protein Greene041679_550 [Parcubacteria group bacterium Greene0416_79]|nr:MAG: Uncharacterized protein Greene041679_550 [Parcubacteria group bacterium Greene0416_79]
MNNVTASLFILAAAGLFFGYVNSTYRTPSGSPERLKKSIVELRAERTEYEEALLKAREIELAQTGLLDTYNSIKEEDRERILKLLPDHIDSVRFIIDVNTIAAGYGLTLQNIALLDDGAAEEDSSSIGPHAASSRAVLFRFSVSGPYDAFRSFLRDIESSLRLIDAENITFAAKEDGAYDYSVTVATYRLED